jgi:hypothetical protein
MLLEMFPLQTEIQIPQAERREIVQLWGSLDMAAQSKEHERLGSAVLAATSNVENLGLPIPR